MKRCQERFHRHAVVQGVGDLQPPNETGRPHHDQQADEAEDEEDESGTKIHRKGSLSALSKFPAGGTGKEGEKRAKTELRNVGGRE